MVFAFSCSHVDAKSQAVINHEFIKHPKDSSKKIEFYWAKPDGEGPWPVIVNIHGHQEPSRPGGKVYVDWGVIESDTKLGYVSIAISQPGYGETDGPADFCGSFTQDAVLEIINNFRNKAFVNKDRIGLIGVSRGAMVSSMVAVRDQNIAGAILISGFYDLKDALPKLTKIGETNSAVAGMVLNIKNEIGDSSDAFESRSALMQVSKIKSPLLIFNGAKDDRTFPEQSRELADKLSKNGVDAKAFIYEEYGHSIPPQIRNKEIIPFLRKYLKGIEK
jgi:dipeptidyl aminopeptidase/acylaminoacyl peptidase